MAQYLIFHQRFTNALAGKLIRANGLQQRVGKKNEKIDQKRLRGF
jgi:hypothetical protein